MTRIEAARAGDLRSVERLLTLCGLPLQGVKDQFHRFVVAVDETGSRRAILGCAGFEAHGSDCVLRSLAVHPEARGRGLARALIETILTTAREAGCTEAYLLTRSIEALAARYGFSHIAREQVPSRLQVTSEFALNACATAAVMRRAL